MPVYKGKAVMENVAEFVGKLEPKDMMEEWKNKEERGVPTVFPTHLESIPSALRCYEAYNDWALPEELKDLEIFEGKKILRYSRPAFKIRQGVGGSWMQICHANEGAKIVRGLTGIRGQEEEVGEKCILCDGVRGGLYHLA